MAQGTLASKRPAYVGRLIAALKRALPRAKVGSQHVRRERYRFMVVSPKFDGMGHPERQRLVWDLADATLKKNELLNVAMIITLGAKE